MKHASIACLALALFALGFSDQTLQSQPAPSSARTILVEAEDAESHNFGENKDLRLGDFEHEVSGGKLLTNFWFHTKAEQRKATWKVKIPADAHYNFWVRIGRQTPTFKWQIGEHKGSVNENTSPEYCITMPQVILGWHHAGEIELKAGVHTLNIELVRSYTHQAVFDCFCFSTEPSPKRVVPVSRKISNRHIPGYFAVGPESDKGDAGLLNLRHLNESVAGARGYVRAKGDQLFTAANKPLRLWGVNASAELVCMSNHAHKRFARFAASRGINAVRIKMHIGLGGDREYPSVNFRIDRIQHFVDALRRQGIYSILCLNSAEHMIQGNHKYYGDYLSEYRSKAADTATFGWFYFNDKAREYYYDALKELLDRRSPYSNKSLKSEPAIAIFELLHGGSLLSPGWNDTPLSGNVAANMFPRAFYRWAEKRYKDWEGINEAWDDGLGEHGDSEVNGQIAISGINSLLGRVEKGLLVSKRDYDTVLFLADYERKFFEEEVEHLKRKLKVRSLISINRVRTTSPSILQPIVDYTTNVGDVVSRDLTMDPVLPHHQSFLDQIQNNLMNDPRTTEKPEIYSNYAALLGNDFRAEYPFTAASFGSSQGVDGFFLGTATAAGWANDLITNGGSSPAIIGTFPALALTYRRGDVQTTGATLIEELVLPETLTGPISTLKLDQDPFRIYRQLKHLDADPPKTKEEETKLAKEKEELAASLAEALLPVIGFTVRNVDVKKAKLETLIKKPLEYVDLEKALVTNTSRELTLGFHQPHIRVNTSRTQGVCGFFDDKAPGFDRNTNATRVFEFKDCQFEARNQYASLTLVALDDSEIKTSKRLLVQAMTRDRTYTGKKTGKGVAYLGAYPINVEEVNATITLKRANRPKRVVALDDCGQPIEASVEYAFEGNQLKIVLPKNCLYTLVEFE
ncbi:MAG: hypothetical protein KDB07_01070 [Planctomycetes bacterium]|nr:hypothetical protein [Planctomycetota bacterium]